VPFCRSLCDYCDFYSLPVKRDDRRLRLFIPRLLGDAERLFRDFPPLEVPTLYIGGGTPPVLGAEGTAKLLGGLKDLFERGRLAWPGEVTLEANPESADRAFLEAARAGGVTRVSLGVQSFYGPCRRAVHRRGAASRLEEKLALVSEYYPRAFSADLMTGLPLQDETVLLRDIEKLLRFGPAHVSLYALTVEEGTPLGEALRRGKGAAGLPGRDEADRLWILGRDALERAGRRQYEVSNFALPGKESLHNIRYWRMENWLGLGPAASGTLIDDRSGRGLRLTLRADLEGWLDRGPEEEAPRDLERIGRAALMKESLLMGFRYCEGPDRTLFARRFGCAVEEVIPRTLEKWRGLLRKDRTAMTGEGLLLLDRFLVEAFEELDGGRR
jgi:oxygen-independent coproporphyrinogen-3 oxidase